MSVFESFLLATCLGILVAILRFAVLAWRPHTPLGRFLARTVR